MKKVLKILSNKNILFIFKISITIFCIAYIFKNYKFDFNYLTKINYYQIIFSFIFLFLNLIFSSLRLKELINEKELFFFIKINWISTFVSIFIPNLIGSELTRGYLLKKNLNKPLKKVAIYIFADRAIGFMTLLFFLINLIYFYNKSFFIILISFSILIFIFIIFYEKKIQEIIGQNFNFNHKIIIYALLSNLAMIFHVYTLLDFNMVKPFTFEIISLIALFIVLNTISISPYGIGVTELIFLKLFENLILENNFLEAFIFSRILLLCFAIFAIPLILNTKNVSKKRISNI